MCKYELTNETTTYAGRTLHRIRALRDFGNVKAGELGGWIEYEANLSQAGNAWVSGDAWVYGNAWVSGDAWVYGNAWVSGDAWVYGNARVSGDAWVYGNAWVSGDAWVYGNARVYSAEAILSISNIGSRNATTTFFACKDGKIGVTCGCFRGDIDQFERAVKQTHGDNKYARQYAVAIQLARVKIEIPKEGGE